MVRRQRVRGDGQHTRLWRQSITATRQLRMSTKRALISNNARRVGSLLRESMLWSVARVPRD